MNFFDDPHGPKYDDLLPIRTTNMTFANGEKQHYVDAWFGYQSIRKRFRGKWVGTTFFQFKGPEVGGALVDNSSKPIEPESFEALAKSFVSLRDQLKLAQLQDPKLAQIIAVLEKRPIGEFIAESLGPSKEARKVRARS